jgi:hypothetical protein
MHATTYATAMELHFHSTIGYPRVKTTAKQQLPNTSVVLLKTEKNHGFKKI